MDLIIKPTVACDFKCTFCSSTSISEHISTKLELDKINQFLDRFPNTKTIIVNGGNPSMMPPSYYQSILDIIDSKGLDTTLSFTDHLYTFYLKPEKWLPIFKHPRVGVTTSFQYSGRIKHDYTPYTEEEFWKVSDQFLSMIGYRPDFISVLTEDTREDWFRLVALARDMNVVCKLNYANASGDVVTKKNGHQMGSTDYHFIIADAYAIYIKIWDLGLEQYEYNTQQLIQTLTGNKTTCPLAKECDSGIRCLQPDGDYYSCGSFGDDKLYSIDFDSEMSGEFYTPLQEDYSIRVMKEDCYTCPNFNICNGCKKGIFDTKRFDDVETHCAKMKSLIPDFERIKQGIRLPDEVDIPFKRDTKKVFNIIRA